MVFQSRAQHGHVAPGVAFLVRAALKLVGNGKCLVAQVGQPDDQRRLVRRARS